MDRMRIIGGQPLRGRIAISGAKNAALPLLAAALLTDKPFTLRNVPHLADISTMLALLQQMGVSVEMIESQPEGGSVLTFNSTTLTGYTAPYELVRKMRASIVVLGPLLARMGQARVSLPGGCAIGTRPVDLHIKGLEALGATIDLADGYIHARAPNGLSGNRFVFPKISVTATENIMMAAALAKGETELVNAAREPEVVDLGRALQKMGVPIEGLGTDTIRIQGVSALTPADHTVVADRIETGTYAVAAAITNGEIELVHTNCEFLLAFNDHLRRAGVDVQQTETGMIVRRAAAGIQAIDVTTEPYPGFPTDLQAQMMALLCFADGASTITETIFENRFMHVPELARMGANINVNHTAAIVRGVPKMKGAPVMATDLRASVSLILAGLAAEGETILSRIYHLDRGYERLDEKIAACGGHVERLTD